MKTIFLGLLAVSIGGICGCSTPMRSNRNTVTSGTERIFNPETRQYEWVTPGKPSTSPGADSTSRQPYR